MATIVAPGSGRVRPPRRGAALGRAAQTASAARLALAACLAAAVAAGCGRPAGTASPAAAASVPTAAAGYAASPLVRQLAAQLSFSLYIPAAVPGDPALTSAQVIARPALVGSASQGQSGQIVIGGLDLVESPEGSALPALSAATSIRLAGLGVTATAGTAGGDGGPKDNAVVLRLGATQVELEAAALSGAALEQIAGSLRAVPR